MSKFIERTTAPELDNIFYNSNENIYYANGSGMPNCPPYAWGRLWEITGKKPTIGLHNAKDWYEAAKRLGYEVGSEPKLGAVICWDGGGSNPYGHIGIVEAIDAEKKPRISESSSSGLYWNNGLVVSPKDNYTHPGANHYRCQGFIYCGIDFTEEPELYYRVQCGAFLLKSNAVRRLNELKAKGFSTYLVKSGLFYKVQVGAYTVRSNADYMLNQVKKAGYDAFITTEKGVGVSVD